jgi:aminomethyltransferase
MMAFGGFEMPVQYSGIIEEHMAVRTAAGLFDVSHMGEVLIQGPEALAFVQHLITNDASTLYDGRALYTVLCTPDGGIIDDGLVYRRSETEYMMVLNAANIARDLEWMRRHNPMGAELTDISGTTALLALQGPKALQIAQPLVNADLNELSYYHFWEQTDGAFLGCDTALLSRTGYTGEPGLELYVPAEQASHVWETLLDAGADHGLQPAGLGARDTLRLEAGLCLHGNDITEETNPYEAGLGWLVTLDKGAFIGREALRSIHESGPDRALVGFVATERGIPRHDHELQAPDGTPIGTVTSGSQSPLLETGIGLGYVPNKPEYTEEERPLRVAGPRRTFSVKVATPPFHEHS